MKKIIKYSILIIIAVFVIYNFLYYNSIDNPAGIENNEVIFEVKSGESLKIISDNLFEAKLLKSKFYFETYVKREDLSSTLQAGLYKLSPILSIKEISRIISQGETLNKEKEIKIIEGWNLDDINSYFLKNKIVLDDKFESIVNTRIWNQNDSIRIFAFLDDVPENATLEGFLFPDTYRIFNDASAEDIVIKMLENFDNKLNDQMREDIKKQGRSIFEIVTMASIIEKEVRSYEDMQVVSGIFWNRIKNKQGLESCATLAYILGVNKPQYTIEDTKIDSPYNTYQNRGLPPGPISQAGFQALQAAVYPVQTDYNFFLSRADNGETIFSRTYDEHLANKAKYLK